MTEKTTGNTKKNSWLKRLKLRIATAMAVAAAAFGRVEYSQAKEAESKASSNAKATPVSSRVAVVTPKQNASAQKSVNKKAQVTYTRPPVRSGTRAGR